MDFTIIPTPRYDMTINKNEGICIRNALASYLALATLTNKERNLLQPILDTLTQQQLGDLP